MAQSLYQQLTAAADALGIDMRAVPADVPAEVKPSARAQRRANREAAMAELRPVKPVVAPAKPTVTAHAIPEMTLDEILSFTVELPTFDLPTVDVCLGEMQADFFRRIAVANTSLLRQADAIRKEMAAYLAEHKALTQEAQVAQFWGQNQRAQDLRNAATKREAARNALKPHLTRVMDAFFNASRVMGERIAMLDDNMAEYLAAQRQAKRAAEAEKALAAEQARLAEAAQKAAEAAAKAAEEAQAETARQLAAAMMAPKDEPAEAAPMATPAKTTTPSPKKNSKAAKIAKLEDDILMALEEQAGYQNLLDSALTGTAGRALSQREKESIDSYREEVERMRRLVADMNAQLAKLEGKR